MSEMPEKDTLPPSSIEIPGEVAISEKPGSNHPLESLIPESIVEERRYHMRKRILLMIEEGKMGEIMAMHCADCFPLLSEESTRNRYFDLAIELDKAMNEDLIDEERVIAFLSQIDPNKAMVELSYFVEIQREVKYLLGQGAIDATQVDIWTEALDFRKTLRLVRKFRELFDKAQDLYSENKLTDAVAGGLLNPRKPFDAYRALTDHESLHNDIEKLAQKGLINGEYAESLLNDSVPARARVDLDKYIRAMDLMVGNKRAVAAVDKARKDYGFEEPEPIMDLVLRSDGVMAKRIMECVVYVFETVTDLKSKKLISKDEIRGIFSGRDILLSDLKVRLIASNID
jgi:hypothetical protein